MCEPEKIADYEDAIITEVLQKAYSRWGAMRKAKKLIDSGWINEMVEKLSWDPVLNNVIEGLLAGKSIESIASDAQRNPNELIRALRYWGIDIDEELGRD